MTPVEPPKKTIGRNTADSTSAIATSAIWISPIDLIVASRGVRSGFSSRMPLDILDHDDRVVDQQADRQHQAEQGQGVDREAGDARAPRSVPSSTTGTAIAGTSVARQLCRKTNMTMIDEHHRLDQRLHDLLDRQLDEVGRVLGVGVAVARRETLRDAARPRP